MMFIIVFLEYFIYFLLLRALCKFWRLKILRSRVNIRNLVIVYYSIHLIFTLVFFYTFVAVG